MKKAKNIKELIDAQIKIAANDFKEIEKQNKKQGK